MGSDRVSIEGELIAESEVPHRDNDFQRAALNSLSFRNLEGGTYRLVKVDDGAE